MYAQMKADEINPRILDYRRTKALERVKAMERVRGSQKQDAEDMAPKIGFGK